jgi:regulator of sigma E protease
MIMRKEPSLKVRMIAQQAGMVVLLALMAFVIFNDIIATLF